MQTLLELSDGSRVKIKEWDALEKVASGRFYYLLRFPTLEVIKEHVR